MPTVDMFNGTKPRRKARAMAHMIDAGSDAILYKCKKCGWESDWLMWEGSVSDACKGVPCEKCNKQPQQEGIKPDTS